MSETERKEEAADRRPLKLYVVGESSGDPGDWPVMCDRTFVIAHDAVEARTVSRRGGECPTAEVEFKEPTLLYVEQDDGVEG